MKNLSLTKWGLSGSIFKLRWSIEMDEGNSDFRNQHQCLFHKLIFNVIIVLLITPHSPPPPPKKKQKKVLNFKSSIFSPTTTITKKKLISKKNFHFDCIIVSQASTLFQACFLLISIIIFIRSKEEINFLRLTDGSFDRNFKN